jgi:hypothetical protein
MTRTLCRKVSDEFTVPLCREHHHQLHRSRNESAWWANVQVAPPVGGDAIRRRGRVRPGAARGS